jgi:hypothetical protein
MSLERYRRIIREEMAKRPGREVGGKTLSQAIGARERPFHLSTFWDALAEEEKDGRVVTTREAGGRRITVRLSAADHPALRAATLDRTADDELDTIEEHALALTGPASLAEVRTAMRGTPSPAPVIIDAAPRDPYDLFGAQVAELVRQGMHEMVERQVRERSAGLQARLNTSERRIRDLEQAVARAQVAQIDAEELARAYATDLDAARSRAEQLEAQIRTLQPLLEAMKALKALPGA